MGRVLQPRESDPKPSAFNSHSSPDAFVLYDKSFVHDLAEFSSCILDNKRKLPRPDCLLTRQPSR